MYSIWISEAPSPYQNRTLTKNTQTPIQLLSVRLWSVIAWYDSQGMSRRWRPLFAPNCSVHRRRSARKACAFSLSSAADWKAIAKCRRAISSQLQAVIVPDLLIVAVFP